MNTRMPHIAQKISNYSLTRSRIQNDTVNTLYNRLAYHGPVGLYHDSSANFEKVEENIFSCLLHINSATKYVYYISHFEHLNINGSTSKAYSSLIYKVKRANGLGII